MIVEKKNKQAEDFKPEKIKKAIELANGRCINPLSNMDIERVVLSIAIDVKRKDLDRADSISVDEIHDLVIKHLKEYSPVVAEEYSNYRNYKKRFNRTFVNVMESTKEILSNGDKENANKDSSLISTQKELISGVVSKSMTLDYELREEWSKAHKSGALQIHDLADYIFNSFNCCLFDMATLLKDGFVINGIKKKEPNSIKTAISVMSDVILSASSQQFGGFTVPEVDTTLAPYVKKSYDKYKKMIKAKLPKIEDEALDKWVDELVYADLKQGIESVEHRLNTINNSNGQTSFTTFSFGLDTTYEGRLVTKAILEVRNEGLGANKVTAIFPKLVYLSRAEVNGLEGTPNYDLYNEAIRVSMRRMYPDYLSLNAGYLGDIYDKYGKAISPMGCRAFLSLWENPQGEAVFIGRANCGAISLNLPRYAILSGGDEAKFFNILGDYIDMAVDIHRYKYEKLRKQKASSNPLFFTQGGCHIKLNPEDTIEEAINTFTWSIGYIGIDEVCRYFVGEGVHEATNIGERILDFINDKIEYHKKETGLLIALYGTPAESMCYRMLELDKKEFGVIPGVTDKDYYTNSFHIQVREKVNGIRKQNIEARLFHKSNGGHIVYNEYPHTKNFLAIKQSIDHAMALGLYKGVNLQLDSCLECNHEGEFSDEVCPKCGSDNILRVNRVCGYLGYRDRFNKGKESETEERVDHYGV